MPEKELKPIVFYDIPCTTPGRPWSPNTMKTRYCLGYKQLPFTTIWVEFPDIAGLLRSKGVTHPPYTLPAIEDPNTGAFIADSLAIATYLDETYSETPTVLSPTARAIVEQAGSLFSFGKSRVHASAAPGTTAVEAPEDGKTDRAHGPLVFLVLGSERLNPVSKAYYHQTRATYFGERWTKLIDAFSESPEARAESVRRGIEAVNGVLQKVTALYASNPEGKKSGGPFVLGEEPCFLDFLVAGRINFVLDGLSSSEKAALAIPEGPIGHLVESLEKYYKY